MIDIISILDEYNIEYRTTGKNVTRGWVEINCPFPQCSDPSYHLGINMKSGLFHCWICGEKGSMEKLVQKIAGVPSWKAKQITKDFDINFQEKEEEKSIVEKVEWPKGIEKGFPDMHRQYLKSRGFNPDFLIKKYQLKACLHLGDKFAYRIIVPVIIDGKIVSLVGRDITGKQQMKYWNLPNELSMIDTKDCLYNIDTVKDKVLIVEGIFDAWSVGDGCVATLGTEYTLNQLRLLYEKDVKEAFVMYDPDATKKAYKLGHTLSSFIPRVEVIELDDKDPADMGKEKIIKLKKEIGL